jgi:hypothetical protein
MRAVHLQTAFALKFQPDPSNLHRRRTLRLPGFDYTLPGAYFITAVTTNLVPLFGEIVNGVMMLNPFGCVAWEIWLQIPNHFPTAQIGAFVVMPNHIHGIIHILENPDNLDNNMDQRPSVNPVGANAILVDVPGMDQRPSVNPVGAYGAHRHGAIRLYEV